MENEVIRRAFAYNGVEVTFAKKGDLLMVNATEMAKPFGKRPVDWTKTDSAKSYMNALTKVKNLTLTDIQRVTKGGKEPGTWFQKSVAMEFARWLSPEFAIWCNDRIEELLHYGITATNQAIDSIIADPDNGIRLLQALKKERQEKQLLAAKNQQQLVQIEAQQEQLQEQKPKVAFADAVLSSPDSVLIGELAKILCQNGYKTGEVRLFEQLRKEGYLCSVGSDRNMPMQRYVEMGLFEVTKGTRSGKNGEQHVTRTTKVTQRGCQYFINKFVSA